MSLALDKRESQKQWDTDPCGAHTVEGFVSESLEFYRAVRDYRYNVYGPWFDSMVRFDDVHGKDVLEIGVGLGSDHMRLASNGNRMTALDLSWEHLRRTRQHLALEGLNTQLVYGDAELMAFRNESFDAVYSFGVLHHTPDIESSISEIHRVLRPGGVAIIGLYHLHSWFFWLQTIVAHGLVQQGLWKKGLKTLMSEIEYRQNLDTAKPLVRVFSRRRVKTLLKGFSCVELRTCHVEPSHFWRFRRLVTWLNRALLERTFGVGGWYVIARAVK